MIVSLRGDPSFSDCGWCSSHAKADGANVAAMVKAAARRREGLIHPEGMCKKSMAVFRDACQ